uniref:Uncharacterized protein n=1 Tax=Parascaris equorum TaxID=6256 RepID=A0A914SCI5_PAREQ
MMTKRMNRSSSRMPKSTMSPNSALFVLHRFLCTLTNDSVP